MRLGGSGVDGGLFGLGRRFCLGNHTRIQPQILGCWCAWLRGEVEVQMSVPSFWVTEYQLVPNIVYEQHAFKGTGCQCSCSVNSTHERGSSSLSAFRLRHQPCLLRLCLPVPNPYPPYPSFLSHSCIRAVIYGVKSVSCAGLITTGAAVSAGKTKENSKVLRQGYFGQHGQDHQGAQIVFPVDSHPTPIFPFVMMWRSSGSRLRAKRSDGLPTFYVSSNHLLPVLHALLCLALLSTP